MMHYVLSGMLYSLTHSFSSSYSFDINCDITVLLQQPSDTSGKIFRCDQLSPFNLQNNAVLVDVSVAFSVAVLIFSFCVI